MGRNGGGAGQSMSVPRGRGLLVVLTAVAAALLIHLFGPALHPSGTETPGSGHLEQAAVVPDVTGAAGSVSAPLPDDDDCHAVTGLAPTMTVVPLAACPVISHAVMTTEIRPAIRPSVGNDGGDAGLDPHRSPGVQRT